MKKRTNTFRQNAVIAWVAMLFISFFTNNVLAQTNWTGAGSTQWEDPTSWSGGVPGPGMVATILACSKCPIINNAVPSIKSLTIKGGASLKMNGNGKLALENTMSGLLMVEASGLLDVRQNANLQAYYFQNWGTVENRGTIASRVMLNFLKFTNKGSILLENPSNQAFVNVPLNPSVQFDNYGLLQITNSSMDVYGLFNNHGSIAVNNGTGNSTTGIQNLGTFVNHASGNINLKDCKDIGLLNVTGSTPGTFNNYGSLTIDHVVGRYGIVNAPGPTGGVNNFAGGSILIKDVPNYGIYNLYAFSNEGQITIQNVAAPALYNEPGTSVFTNGAKGVVLATDVSRGIVNRGTFTNRGSFTIEDADGRGIEHESIMGQPFLNDATGQLTVDGAGEMGFAVYQGPLVNAGRIEIRNAAAQGLYLAAPFENLPTGQLVIDQVGTYALSSYVQTKNYGSIAISNSNFEGIACMGLFENFAPGIITVLQNQPSAWPSISNGGAFYNAGTVHFLGDNLKSITNGAAASFVNRPCANLNINGLIINNNSIVNQGLFKSTYAGMHQGPSTFVNTGILEDFSNSFQGVPYSNSAFRIRPIHGTVGGVIYNAIEAGGMPPFIIGSTWYKNANLTQSAGTFNFTMNSFTPTVGVGTHTLYFTMKDLANNCTKTVSVQVNIASAMVGFGEKARPDIVLFNQPNPFVNETRIKLSLPFDASGKLVVYDNFGRLAQVVYEGELSKGELYEFGVDASNMRMASYLATLLLDDGRSYSIRLVKADQ